MGPLDIPTTPLLPKLRIHYDAPPLRKSNNTDLFTGHRHPLLIHYQIPQKSQQATKQTHNLQTRKFNWKCKHPSWHLFTATRVITFLHQRHSPDDRKYSCSPDAWLVAVDMEALYSSIQHSRGDLGHQYILTGKKYQSKTIQQFCPDTLGICSAQQFYCWFPLPPGTGSGDRVFVCPIVR